MPSKRTHDVTATVGEYTASNGAVKKRYVNVGSAFTDEQGRLSIKMESVPVSPEWTGWLSLYPIKDKEDRESDRRQQGGSSMHQKEPYSRDNGANMPDGEEIPFRSYNPPLGI